MFSLCVSEGDYATIVGLKSRPHWNGQIAYICKYYPEKQRYHVKLENKINEEAYLKESNLEKNFFYIPKTHKTFKFKPFKN